MSTCRHILKCTEVFGLLSNLVSVDIPAGWANRGNRTGKRSNMSQGKKTSHAARGGQRPDRGTELRDRLKWGAVFVVVLGGAVALAISVTQPEPPPPPELEAVETFPDMGVQHLAAGASTPEYNSDPPTSGPHAQAPAPCGIYREPVPDTAQLHSMEHGAVVIQYDPDLPQDQLTELEGINWSSADEVIVAPRPDSPAPVALTAWNKRLLLDGVDVEVITAFEREFGNQSPEGGAQCPFQVDQTR